MLKNNGNMFSNIKIISIKNPRFITGSYRIVIEQLSDNGEQNILIKV